jgi:hypothetical protein
LGVGSSITSIVRRSQDNLQIRVKLIGSRTTSSPQIVCSTRLKYMNQGTTEGKIVLLKLSLGGLLNR